MALRISRTARRRYGLDDLLPPGGRLEPPGLPTLRHVAERVNRARALDEAAPRLSGGSLLAASAIEDRLMERIAQREERRPGADWERLLARLRRLAGPGRVEEALGRWRAEFAEPGEPPAPPADELRELGILWLLEREREVGPIVSVLAEGAPRAAELVGAGDPGARRKLGRTLARLGRAAHLPGGPLPDAVRTLAQEPAGPRFGGAVGDAALAAADALAEERRPAFAPPAGAPAGPPPEAPPAWRPGWSADSRYAPESPWMAEVVMVAKHVQVWLDQLSRQRGRPLRRLDEVPDEELERLAGWGFNTLWLVGIWERSRASRWIKQLGGNPEASASAYAVADYHVAEDLGGEPALAALRERAAARGLRLAADLVANHLGIDSRWVLEHPDRFLSLEEPPFPTYSFRGPDLSPDPEVGLYLEDHYFDRSDAAVVFQRLDRRTGETRYLYHGNDGTGLPWNDTAQLDYLEPGVRQAMLETIVEAARSFPVLRFDAAMTLARRHYQRLWFPLPGEGGAIPSRAGHGVGPREFEERFPREFWREVVDRVAAEAPETLLVAEAFWLMEAYFARELGLHRVYNSAFLHHLRAGDLAGLRRHLAESLLLDPALLAHQVNYLSNPDELPAREAFGAGEGYLAASILLATLPGLPLFAHGQVEGLRERYGMEYRRAYRDEAPDPALVAAHERRIVPLLRRRRVFAGTQDFRLYELRGRASASGDVLVYSNGRGDGLHLVASNPGPASVRGTIDRSLPFLVPGGGPAARTRLAELLPPGGERGAALTALDLTTGERLRWPAAAGRPLVLDLGPGRTRVLADFAWESAAGAVRARPLPWWRRLWVWLRDLLRRMGSPPLAS